MRYITLIAVISVLGATAASAQATADSTDIYIVQSGQSGDYLINYLDSEAQFTATGENSFKLRFSEQGVEMVRESAQIGDWEVLPASLSGYGRCVWLERCEKVSVFSDRFPQRLPLEYEQSELPETAQATDSLGLEEILSDFGDDSDAAMEAFRQAFEAVLEEQNNQKSSDEFTAFELNGMVLDETRSKTGRDFYEMFYSRWIAMDKGSTATIQVSERFYPGSGSVISIEIDGSESFSFRLRPGSDMISQSVDSALNRIGEYLNVENENQTIY